MESMSEIFPCVQCELNTFKCEIRGEILVAFSAVTQSSSELFWKSHPTFFELFPADFVGILEDWPFGPGHVFMLQYNSQHLMLFFHFYLSLCPPSYFFHLSFVHPFSYSGNCLGFSLVLFSKSFPFLSLPIPLLPQSCLSVWWFLALRLPIVSGLHATDIAKGAM